MIVFKERKGCSEYRVVSNSDAWKNLAVLSPTAKYFRIKLRCLDCDLSVLRRTTSITEIKDGSS
jgi:hypothetical protein